MSNSPDSSVYQRAYRPPGTAVVKLEPDLFTDDSFFTSCLNPPFQNKRSERNENSELVFLRSRVRELEREKTELTTENQRLHTLLVQEIPGLLSSMWQTLGQSNRQSSVSTATHSHGSVSMATDGYSPYTQQQQQQQQQQTVANGPSPVFSPVSFIQESEWEESQPHTHCSQNIMEDQKSLCTPQSQVNQVEVFPGSGVMCDLRSFHSANEASSPTAMARLLLLGVFDLHTLTHSNLRGGRSRRPSNTHQHNALDPHKTNAIYNAILSRFPLAKRGVIGSGINSKLSEIRYRSRRANQEALFL